jgi:cellulose synthase (UDP-forming)
MVRRTQEKSAVSTSEVRAAEMPAEHSSDNGNGASPQRPVVSAESVPRIPEAQERIIRLMAVLSLAFGAYWLWWRWTETINWEHPIFSLILVSAETFGLISTVFMVITVWRITHREPPPAPEGLKVDVFITCYDEPLQLIRRTAIGARAITYPHKTYVLDDGKRDEVRTMCEMLGIGYIRRDGNEHAKAGNLNNALRVTDGEFILQLDADHVPLPTMLDRLLGYFNDPKVAFVQSPQDFYNTDSFTHVVNDEGRRMWEENRIFFSLIQPGKDRFNAAFFCGSCGVLRRSAFEEIGGFSTRTVTEDMETSLVLHSRGWRSIYHGETLAYGLAPASAGQYHVQRLRWGQGSMQILRKLNPLTYPGLTQLQRMAYFSSTIVYVDGLQKLIFYLAPIVFLFTGWLPVDTVDSELLIRLIPYLILTIVSFELLARGTGYILVSERYNMTKFMTYIAAISGFFTNKKLKFAVTPKGEGDVPFSTYAPQLVLAILCVASLIWATLAYRYGWVVYPGPGWESVAFKVNAFWVLWNLYFACYVIAYSIKSRQHRQDHRFAQRLPTQIDVLDDDGKPTGEPHVATTEDFNTNGLSFRGTRRYEPGSLLRIPLPLASETVVTTGRVAHVSQKQTRDGMVYSHGVTFEELPLEARDAIELHCAHHAVPMWQQVYRQSVDPVARAIEHFADMRGGGRRRTVGLPALVSIQQDGERVDLGIGMLEEVSPSGARLMLENPVPPGTSVQFEVPGTTLSGNGTVVFNRAFESPLHVNFAVGIKRNTEPAKWLKVPSVREWFSTRSAGAA